VLILPPGHALAVKAQRSLSRREKWILGSVLAAIAAVVVAVVISIGTAEHQTANGCVDVKFPITIGGAEIYRCGASAQALCAGVGRDGGLTSVADRAVATQCRKARLPVG
jgi:ABC-type Co2+ transport system permease subunit